LTYEATLGYSRRVIDAPEYESRVRDAAWAIVSREYEAYERTAIDPHDQRFVGMRPFWSGFVFDDVSVEGSYPDTKLVVRFSDTADVERKYGFREGIWKVVQWWEDYGPPADMPNDPERLAHEMLFIMVYSIADTPGEVFERPSTGDVEWFTGGEAWTEVVTDGKHMPLLR
jgi:hypothetical protein